MSEAIDLTKLSRQEENVIVHALSGLSDKEIAVTLGLSIHTVRTYWERVREKFGGCARSELLSRIVESSTKDTLAAKSDEVEKLKKQVLELNAQLEKATVRLDLLNAIFETAPCLVYYARGSGEILLANRAYMEYTGITSEQVNRETWQTIVHPDDLPKVLAGVGELMVYKRPIEAIIRLRRADGVYRWHLAKGCLVDPENEDHLARRVGMSVDINDLAEKVLGPA